MNDYTFSEIEAIMNGRDPLNVNLVSREGLSANFTVIITEEMMQTFCKLTGDVNPMHIDIDFARANGYDENLVYGMLTSSFYSTLVGVYLPGKYCILQDIHVKFRKPVYVGDKLTITGEITEIFESVRRLEIKAMIKNQRGEKISSAIIKVGCIK